MSETNYKCDVCGKKFSTKQKKVEHGKTCSVSELQRFTQGGEE